MTTWVDAAVWLADGSTVDELDDGPVMMWCPECEAMTWADWLTEYEGAEEDMNFARCCLACGSWCQDEHEPAS